MNAIYSVSVRERICEFCVKPSLNSHTWDFQFVFVDEEEPEHPAVVAVSPSRADFVIGPSQYTGFAEESLYM